MKTNKENGLPSITRKRRRIEIYKEIHQEYTSQTLPCGKFKGNFAVKMLDENSFYNLLHKLEHNGLIEMVLNKCRVAIQVVVKE